MKELAEYMASQGHHVTVVTGFPNYPNGVIYPGYKRRLIQQEAVNGVNLIRTFLLVTPERLSFAPRLKNYLSFMCSAFYGGLLSGRHDLIYFYSPPLFLGITANLLGRMWRAPVVMELNDLWPRGPISLGIIKRRWQKRIAHLLENVVYQWSTRIFTYSVRMREELLQAGVPEEKVEIHNLSVDTQFFSPVPQDVGKRIRMELGLDEYFIAMYTGLVGMAQGLETVLDTAEILQNRGEEKIRLVIVGGGPDRKRLMAKSSEKELDNVLFVDQQPIGRMPAFMAASDVLLSLLKKAPHRVGTIPAKILAYMAAAKPVVVSAEGEAADLVKRCECGVAVPPDLPDALADALMKMQRFEQAKLEQFGKRARKLAVREFEKTHVFTNLEQSLIKVVNGD